MLDGEQADGSWTLDRQTPLEYIASLAEKETVAAKDEEGGSKGEELEMRPE